MSFQSPAWGTEPLPLDPSAQGSLMDTRRRSSVFSGRSVSPHMQKPQSPPRLVMPDNDGSPSFAPNNDPASSGSTGNQNFVQPPVINAPDDGGDNGSGPSLRIVPATPVSGGGLGNPGDGRMPFHQQRPAGNNLGVIDEPFRGDFSAQRSPPMPGQAPNGANISRPPSSSPQQQPAKFTFPQNRDSSPLPTTGPGAGNFLFPTGPRSRSKSDTSVSGGSPVALWNNSPFSRQHESVDDSALSLDDHHSGPAPPQPSTVNMNDITPATQHQQSLTRATSEWATSGDHDPRI
jgi:transcription factor CRZ1